MPNGEQRLAKTKAEAGHEKLVFEPKKGEAIPAFLKRVENESGMRMVGSLPKLSGKEEIYNVVVSKDIHDNVSLKINWKKPPSRGTDVIPMMQMGATPAVAGTTAVPIRVEEKEREVLERYPLSVSFENAIEKAGLAQQFNEEIRQIPEKERKGLLKKMGYSKGWIDHYMMGLDRDEPEINQMSAEVSWMAEKGKAMENPQLREALAKSANATASEMLAKFMPYILWKYKTQKGGGESAKSLAQLQDANAYLAYVSMFNLYNMKGDIGGSMQYIAKPSESLNKNYYSLVDYNPMKGSIAGYKKAADGFFSEYSKYANRQTGNFAYDKDMAEAKTWYEKTYLAASPFMEASVPWLMVAVMGCGPGGLMLGELYFGSQSIQKFKEGRPVEGSLMAVAMAAPFFGKMMASSAAAMRTAGAAGRLASKGAGYTFQVAMAKDAFGIVVDASKYGWSRNDAASLVGIGGFMAMPREAGKIAREQEAPTGAAPETAGTGIMGAAKKFIKKEIGPEMEIIREAAKAAPVEKIAPEQAVKARESPEAQKLVSESRQALVAAKGEAGARDFGYLAENGLTAGFIAKAVKGSGAERAGSERVVNILNDLLGLSPEELQAYFRLAAKTEKIPIVDVQGLSRTYVPKGSESAMDLMRRIQNEGVAINETQLEKFRKGVTEKDVIKNVVKDRHEDGSFYLRINWKSPPQNPISELAIEGISPMAPVASRKGIQTFAYAYSYLRATNRIAEDIEAMHAETGKPVVLVIPLRGGYVPTRAVQLKLSEDRQSGVVSSISLLGSPSDLAKTSGADYRFFEERLNARYGKTGATCIIIEEISSGSSMLKAAEAANKIREKSGGKFDFRIYGLMGQDYLTDCLTSDRSFVRAFKEGVLRFDSPALQERVMKLGENEEDIRGFVTPEAKRAPMAIDFDKLTGATGIFNFAAERKYKGDPKEDKSHGTLFSNLGKSNGDITGKMDEILGETEGASTRILMMNNLFTMDNPYLSYEKKESERGTVVFETGIRFENDKKIVLPMQQSLYDLFQRVMEAGKR